MRIATMESGGERRLGLMCGGASTSLNDGDEVICQIEKIGMLRTRVRCAA
jgi:2-keto-4-pentenoate hydratase/2-oxohepta-3-ene-1,7-dioic acid hydratase in catechol pathway